VDAALDHGETIDHVLHRVLDRFERIQRALFALFDLGDFALDGVNF